MIGYRDEVPVPLSHGGGTPAAGFSPVTVTIANGDLVSQRGIAMNAGASGGPIVGLEGGADIIIPTGGDGKPSAMQLNLGMGVKPLFETHAEMNRTKVISQREIIKKVFSWLMKEAIRKGIEEQSQK